MTNRELDAWIAEHVMGFTRDGRYFKNDHEWLVTEYSEDELRPYSWGGGWSPGLLPKYSSDIAAAWTVAEKMKVFGYTFMMECDHGMEWDYRVWFGDNEMSASFAPMAICLAAKKALEK